jgi:hypothetical protein
VTTQAAGGTKKDVEKATSLAAAKAVAASGSKSEKAGKVGFTHQSFAVLLTAE